MNSWGIVDKYEDMNVLQSTWEFNCKRFLVIIICKFKAGFCVRDTQQIEGVDLFDTFDPFV